jgi:hypothetical protein
MRFSKIAFIGQDFLCGDFAFVPLLLMYNPVALLSNAAAPFRRQKTFLRSR